MSESWNKCSKGQKGPQLILLSDNLYQQTIRMLGSSKQLIVNKISLKIKERMKIATPWMMSDYNNW